MSTVTFNITVSIIRKNILASIKFTYSFKTIFLLLLLYVISLLEPNANVSAIIHEIILLTTILNPKKFTNIA